MKTPEGYLGWMEEAALPSEELEAMGVTVYRCGDGTSYYSVFNDAPEETHFLASGAAQGDPDSMRELGENVDIEEELPVKAEAKQRRANRLSSS
jgi:hypothetical protein